MKLLICVAVCFVLCLSVPGTQGGDCPGNFISINDRCYHFSNDQHSWYGSFKACVELGANLASIETSEENEAIKDHLRGLKLTRHYWIGASDESQEGYFVWISTLKGANFTDWCPGDPNNYGRENCVYYNHDCDYQWQDRSCDFFYSYYVCEQ